MSRAVVVSVISNLEYGGAQRQLVEIANNLDRAEVEHHIVSLSPYVPLADSLDDRTRLHVIEKRWRFDVSVVSKLAGAFGRLKADVVHGYLFDADIATRLAAKLAGTPVVVAAERNADYNMLKRKRIGYALTKALVDVCIANSAAGAAYSRRLLGYREYRVVPNGVNTQRFAPVAANTGMRRSIGIEDGDFVIGMVASFKHQKNHGMLFRGVQAAVARGVPARVVLVGDELYAGLGGTTLYRQQMLQWLEENGLRNRCLFLGNRLDLERVYPAFDVSVLTSHFEGTPNVVLEAMACGVPVVATDVSDNRALIPDGRVGFVVAPDDAAQLGEHLVHLFENPDLRARLGSQARDWAVEEYATSRLAERTRRIYMEFLERARCRIPASHSRA
jgi:glycosyltransferase involved in cell wall biosynthesis